MFKNFKELCDVVSLVVYCPAERSFLLTKEASGEYWIPSSKSEKSCWKSTAHKINFELFGMDTTQCSPLRIYKVWLPNHNLPSVYHVVYKVSIKADVKKRAKLKNVRRLLWFTNVELERQKAHSNLRSPEVAVYAQMILGEVNKELQEKEEVDTSLLVEICEDNVIVSSDVGAGGAVAVVSPQYQLIQAANYIKEDQIRLYREFLVMVFPAVYMSPHVFTLFMMDVGWQRQQCQNLFRAADIMSRGGLSFSELMLWTAAVEPHTQHSGLPAEIRCKYIFRYFDINRDLKLEYMEFKELVAAARVARQLPIDALSVAREADVCLRQLGLQANAPLTLDEFLRGVGELRLRGTSALLRAPNSIAGYLFDLLERDKVTTTSTMKSQTKEAAQALTLANKTIRENSANSIDVTNKYTQQAADYNVASLTVKLKTKGANELVKLSGFDEDALSRSAARLITGPGPSLEALGPMAAPVEAINAVHFFATSIEKLPRRSTGSSSGKAALSWANPSEEAALGVLILKLAETVRGICANEPRLLKISSPVYVIGDLHGNLPALLAIEAALWPSGPAYTPSRLLFLGDYVDRGAYGSELMAYLLAAKVQRPKAVFLIRGNHETRDIQKMFTFYNECIGKYGESEGVKIWNAINLVFDALPLAALVDDKVFCCHGGIPPPWVCPLISAIDKVPCPLPRPAEQSSIAWELLWNDPVKSNKMTTTLSLELAANEGFASNAKRGTGHIFDQSALDRFLLANHLSHVLRAHELHNSGFMCQLRGRLISVFSSIHYCGGLNDCGVALLDGGKCQLRGRLISVFSSIHYCGGLNDCGVALLDGGKVRLMRINWE